MQSQREQELLKQVERILSNQKLNLHELEQEHFQKITEELRNKEITKT